jgi:hypothetical protein
MDFAFLPVGIAVFDLSLDFWRGAELFLKQYNGQVMEGQT